MSKINYIAEYVRVEHKHSGYIISTLEKEKIFIIPHQKFTHTTTTSPLPTVTVKVFDTMVSKMEVGMYVKRYSMLREKNQKD